MSRWRAASARRRRRWWPGWWRRTTSWRLALRSPISFRSPGKWKATATTSARRSTAARSSRCRKWRIRCNSSPTAGLDLCAVVFIPEATALTRAARAALPPTVPHADAAFNLAAAGGLVLGLHMGDARLIAAGMHDRLHEPYRARLFPHLEPMTAAARAAGALGACLSGAGPSVLALDRAGSHPGDRRGLSHRRRGDGHRRARCASLPWRRWEPRLPTSRAGSRVPPTGGSAAAGQRTGGQAATRRG